MSIAGSFFCCRALRKYRPLQKKSNNWGYAHNLRSAPTLLDPHSVTDSGPVVRFSEVRSEIKLEIMFWDFKCPYRFLNVHPVFKLSPLEAKKNFAVKNPKKKRGAIWQPLFSF